MVRLPARRHRQSQFERASDGSMTLMEHLRDLRTRLFRASVSILVGFIASFFWLAQHVQTLLERPYCQLAADEMRQAGHGVLPAGWQCNFVQLGVTDVFVLRMKIALYLALIIASPFWLYQLWAFIAPGLHRHERRWAYLFVGLAAPLFAAGSVLAYFVIAKGLAFLLQFNGPDIKTTLEITKYVDFITGLMLLFGVAFLFPLVVMLFNIAGLASAKRLLGWWRVAVFLFYAFAAIATPTADPFGMTFLGLSLSALYFGAVGFAFLNDRRRERRQRAEFGDVADDETSSIEYDVEPIEEGEGAGGLDAVAPSAPVSTPLPLDRRYDDST